MLNEKIKELSPWIDALNNHPIYESLNTVDNLRHFMEHHVFAVWDFMCLLKKLQNIICPAGGVWLPPKDSLSSAIINEIVLGEESDKDLTGRRCSHFELYLQAMKEVGAQTAGVEAFVKSAGALQGSVVLSSYSPPHMRTYLSHVLGIIGEGEAHKIAASFAFGRETIIPGLFKSLLSGLKIEDSVAPNFHYYLNRHIQLDGEEHGDLTIKLVSNLCKGDSVKINEAIETAKMSLKVRGALWDQILVSMPDKLEVNG